MSKVGPVAAEPTRFGGGGASPRWVAGAAGLCAVHCLASPVLALVAPFLVISEGGEWWLWAGTLLMAIVLLAVGPIPRNSAVTVLVATGAGVWACSLLGWFEPLPEWLTSPMGSLLIASGMLWSARLCRSGACGVGEAASEGYSTGP